MEYSSTKHNCILAQLYSSPLLYTFISQSLHFSRPSPPPMLPPLRIANPIKALKALIRQKKALAAPLPTCISLSTLKPLPGTTKIKQRLGRSRQAGRFCGRGNGGTKSYAGSHFSKLFEGGAVPFHLKVPKYGRKNM